LTIEKLIEFNALKKELNAQVSDTTMINRITKALSKKITNLITAAYLSDYFLVPPLGGGGGFI